MQGKVSPENFEPQIHRGTEKKKSGNLVHPRGGHPNRRERESAAFLCASCVSVVTLPELIFSQRREASRGIAEALHALAAEAVHHAEEEIRDGLVVEFLVAAR